MRFVAAILILIISVWCGIKIAEDPGMAVFLYHDWSVEMPLWFVILCFIILILILYFLVHFIDTIDISFYRLKNWLRWRRKKKSYKKTNLGLLALLEGRWQKAENYLLAGIDQSDAPLINYLAAAKAADERNASDERDLYLQKAHNLPGNNEIVISLTQAKLQFQQGQLEQAIATLNHLRTISPKNSIALKLSQKIYARLEDWKNLIKLLPNLYKTKLITKEQFVFLEQQAYLKLFNAKVGKISSLKSLQDLWQTIPRSCQANSNLVFCYIEKLAHYTDAASEVEELIHKTLKKTWHRNMVKLYGVLVTKQPKKQLAHAEGWLKKYPNHPILFLTLGRICVRCQLWGKARHYFEDSLQLEAHPETYGEYGKLLEHLDEKSKAMEIYKKGLELLVLNAQNMLELHSLE